MSNVVIGIIQIIGLFLGGIILAYCESCLQSIIDRLYNHYKISLRAYGIITLILDILTMIVGIIVVILMMLTIGYAAS